MQVAKWGNSLAIRLPMASGSATLYSEDMQAGLRIEQSLAIVNPFTS